MLLYIKERTIAMTIFRHSLFWAAALLGIAPQTIYRKRTVWEEEDMARVSAE